MELLPLSNNYHITADVLYTYCSLILLEMTMAVFSPPSAPK